jgi:hypothetical protein
MEGSVLKFLKAEWKVSDTGSAQCWASSYLSQDKLSQENLLSDRFYVQIGHGNSQPCPKSDLLI